MENPAAPDGKLKVHAEKDGRGGYRFLAGPHAIIDSWLRFEFTDLENFVPDLRMPFEQLIRSGADRVYLFSLRPDGKGPRSFGVSYSFARGNPDEVRLDRYHRYLFPFEHGRIHQVTQGYNGRFSHYGENQYALDFDLDAGAVVCAARAGVVAEVKDNSSLSGLDAGFAPHGNYLLIAHDDGSFANYAHLRRGGSLVRPGETVEAGQRIAYSGNTGRTSGPHLHFDVRIPTKTGRMRSVPVSFLDGSSAPVVPLEGRTYRSCHPGVPLLLPLSSGELTNADFADYERRIVARGTVDFRVDSRDPTYVVFARNGLPTPATIRVHMGLRDMISSIPMPAVVRVPAATEVFITLLRPAPGARRYGYTCRLEATSTQ
ncbi:MAG TPA: M23 family metallopeptidase [Spirochaetia bacterium]|nr:M23 family metallopeptidase [Spirochaetia bacterium]